MERSYVGFASTNAAVSLKQDETHLHPSPHPSALMRNPGMQWSFGSKVSAIPQLLSFKAAPEDKPRKSIHDSMTAPGFGPVSTVDAFDSSLKSYSGLVQKNMNLDKPGGNPYAISTYATPRFDAYPVYQPQETRIHPISSPLKQTITVSTNTPVLQSHLASTRHSLVVNSMNPQPLGSIPIASTPAPVLPMTSPIVGTTDLRESSKSSGGSAQLTIFYAGSVCVYDDVSSEKAQAIMLLAGNGSPGNKNRTLSTAQVHAPSSRPSVGDAYIGSKILTASPCSALPSPISVTSSSTNELSAVKPGGALAVSANKTEPVNAVGSVGTTSVTVMPAGAVPQARKASLARFLEKRKERFTNTSPYNVSRKSPDQSDAREFNRGS